ncbi:MAG: sugar ABC transporter ATP-binding protein [Firmicutes bacterium]|nr:sugar ABC transporter ATP-binding protein [Bacillota bacterium]
MKGISKRFDGVHALDNVDFELLPGEVHALVGENGAGKSTLSKILSGVHRRDGGDVVFDGRPVDFAHPYQAQSQGIFMVPQEINLIPYLRVFENVFLGREEMGTVARLLKKDEMRRGSREALLTLGCDVHPDARARELSVAQQQMVAIAKALFWNPKVIVLDEPTSALTLHETERLMGAIRAMKGKGIAIVYISHRLEEVLEISDRITVLRDGRLVGTIPTPGTTRDQLIKMMVGRELTGAFARYRTEKGDVALEVRNLTLPGVFKNVSFTLRSGEVLALTGLVGARRTEVARAIFGLSPQVQGEVFVRGKRVRIRRPADAIDLGMGFVTEDRKAEGLFMDLSVARNSVMVCLKHHTWYGFTSHAAQARISADMARRLAVKTPSPWTRVKQLSGGNQQKVVLTKWLLGNCSVLILDEPTRGIDVGAKADIHDLVGDLLSEGVAVLLISSELPEVLSMADRIIVMQEGKVTGRFAYEEATQEEIMRCATGEWATCLSPDEK